MYSVVKQQPEGKNASLKHFFRELRRIQKERDVIYAAKKISKRNAKRLQDLEEEYEDLIDYQCPCFAQKRDYNPELRFAAFHHFKAPEVTEALSSCKGRLNKE
jgi:hypothetical protein